MEQYGKAKIFAVTKRVTRKNDHGKSYSTSVVVPNRFEVGGIFGMAHRRFHSVQSAKDAIDEQIKFNARLFGVAV
jgi:hypothetical protein